MGSADAIETTDESRGFAMKFEREKQKVFDSSEVGAPAPCLVEVALPVPVPNTFTYRFTASSCRDERLLQKGDLVSVPFGRRDGMIGLVVSTDAAHANQTEVAGRRLRDIKRVFPQAYRLEPERFRLAHWMSAYYGLPLGEVVPLFHPPAPGTKARKTKKPEAVYPLSDSEEIQLSRSQRECVEMAERLIADRSFGTVLVHGVTGSGKTEIYLQVIATALSLGRSAIYLLPEIALTPQTLARIIQRFGIEAAAIHSGLSVGERCRVHEAAAAGEIRVVVGPRSALFVPVQNLGAVIVDEEHETSYKQEEKPRYHARHVAMVRARENAAVVLLGSATPDLESYHNGHQGRYRLVTLSERAVGELPVAELVDMRGRPAPEGFSPRLVECIGQTLDVGQQVILFYNRRGFARALQCSDCGETVMCPHCDIGLTYHLRPRRLLCHYCGFALPVPEVCPTCDSPRFLTAGGGTEKVELTLAGLFPQACLLRLDQDTTRRRGSHARILTRFAAGEAQILIGTQMVAKGHHFPRVGLVGVLAADDGLTLPDFRAGERVFQLLTQVAGRAGRIQPGRVVFQTYRPEDPIICAAANHDFEAFVVQELEARHGLGYPPFRRLLRVGLSGRRLGATDSAACVLADAFRNALQGEERDILGPAPAVFPRLQDRYRFQILIKGNLSFSEKRWLSDCLRAYRAKERGVEAVLDVDPLGLY